MSRARAPRWCPWRLRVPGVALVLALAGLPFLGGCGNPTASVARCIGAADATVAAIQEQLTVKGTLRNGKMVKPQRANGYTMVSAELHAAGDDKHDKGDILTWAARDVDGARFVSVDVNARDDSRWPHASFGVAENGVIESRACTGLNLGKTKAQIECEQNSGSSSADVAGGHQCSDL